MTWWLYLLISAGVALVYWVIQNVQHEGMHALAVCAQGGHIKRFRPYLHRKDNGKWAFASLNYSFDAPISDTGKSWVMGAPWAANVILIIALSIGNRYGPHHVGSAILLGITINNLVDGFNNARCAWRAASGDFNGSHSDIPRFSKAWGHTKSQTVGMMIGWFIASTVLAVFGAIP